MDYPIWMLERAGIKRRQFAEVFEHTEPRRLALVDGAVVVTAPDGVVIQRIEYDPEALTDENRDYFMTTPDINFDGWPDLLLISSQGLQNIFYEGWLWDPAIGRYTYVPEIRELASPVFDERTQTVTTFDHGSATDNVSGVYRWEDGKLVEIRRREQEFDVDTGLFTVRLYERGEDGVLRLVREETLTEAEMQFD